MKILCLDFDGVIHSYESGWEDVHIISDPPVPGAFDAIKAYQSAGFEVQIYSSRSGTYLGRAAMMSWMQKWAFEDGEAEDLEWLSLIKYPQAKPPAFVTLDDRALNFTGTWPAADDLLNFKPWNKK